jgi:hypothetical protein
MYLLGMFLVLMGERMIGGDDSLRWGLDGLGVFCFLTVLQHLGKDMMSAKGGQLKSYRVAFSTALVGCFSLVLYVFTTDWGLEFMGHDLLSGVNEEAEAAERYWVVMTCLWMLVWLAGTLPFVAADWVLFRNPMAVDASATRKAALSALSVALLLGALFPINYWTSQQDPAGWVEDHSYFKAPTPGDQARLLVENLDVPITAYAFFPEADVVRDQVERYLTDLEGGLFAVEIIDQAMEPTLSEELKVRDNGWIAFVRGEGEDQQIERLKLGLAKKRRDLDTSTRNKIKDFDSEVLQRLRKISSSKQTIYLLNEHGEMHWNSQNSEFERISTFKKMVGQYNYQVESLGMEGLSDGVPDDAVMVMILGAYLPFTTQEIDALNAYREQGGSLLIALRPARSHTADMSGLLEPLGLEFDGNRTLAHSNYFYPVIKGPIAQYFIYTTSYTTHSSVSLLSKQKANSRQLIMPFSGVLTQIEGSEASPQEAIKSMAETFGETDKVPNFDSELESKSIYSLGFAVSGPAADGGMVEGTEEPKEWRVFVTAGSNWISDAFITGHGGEADYRMGNTQLIVDLLGWLGNDPSIQGSVNSEEDRKVEHTEGAAGWIFYGTTFIMPFIFLFIGKIRLEIRRKGGMA